MRRFQPTRESFIPKGALKISDKHSDAVVYLHMPAHGRPCAMFFCGDRARPDANNSFSSTASRETAVIRYFESRQRSATAKAKDAAERRAWVCDYKPGDVLYTSWGYDQTNIDYYRIESVSGCMLTVRRLPQDRTETNYMSGDCQPTPNAEPTGKPIRVRASIGGCSIDGHAAYRWDGKPNRYSSYA